MFSGNSRNTEEAMEMKLKCLLVCLICLCLIFPASVAEEAAAIPESKGLDWQENDPWPFAILHGDRSKPQVAVTMDDCFEFEWVEKAWELITSYGGAMTIYPIGELLKEDALKPGDREMWQRIAASQSEIGTHTHHHRKMINLREDNMLLYTKYPQQVIDQLLGYHYPLRTIRPPYGSYNDAVGRQIKTAGYSHVILWDIDSTDPEEVLRLVQNGSIILFHARSKDYRCLQTVIPALAERGYELVTVSTLLGLPPLEEETELFDWRAFKKTLNR